MFRRKDTTNFLYMNVNGNQLFKPKFIISVVRLIVVYSDKILMALVASFQSDRHTSRSGRSVGVAIPWLRIRHLLSHTKASCILLS